MFLLAILFVPILVALCIVALTGNIYRNAYDKNGNLIIWGIGNKVAAIVILLIELLALPLIYHNADRLAGSSQQRAEYTPPPSTVSQSQPAQPAASPTPTESMPLPTPMPRTESSYSWNTDENDAMQNGNIGVAVNWLARNPNLRSLAKPLTPSMVAKTPYVYYGQVAVFAGVVAVVQDYAPGSDIGQLFGGHNASDIVMGCDDGTIVELLCMKASGYIAVGHAVRLYGYPVGVTEVPNRVGGTFTHLILVGNDYDDLGAVQQ